MKSEDLTIDDLARLVQEGFAECNTVMTRGFNQMHNHFAQIREELQAIRETIKKHTA